MIQIFWDDNYYVVFKDKVEIGSGQNDDLDFSNILEIIKALIDPKESIQEAYLEYGKEEFEEVCNPKTGRYSYAYPEFAHDRLKEI